MRYPTIPTIPGAYIESSYDGHKASPGKYTVTLQIGDQTVSTEAEILANPLYAITAADYKEYNTVMTGMEIALTTMHRMVNSMNAKRIQLEELMKTLPSVETYKSIKAEGAALVKKMKAWDEDMIQRKSKAYDDVENFPNKFTANYLFLLNQTESDIPRVTQPELNLLKELNMQWAVLQNRGKEIMDTNIPDFNKLLWEAGVGAIWDK
jgi:thioester reductase-like protein